jgi:hypothetical protein
MSFYFQKGILLQIKGRMGFHAGKRFMNFCEEMSRRGVTREEIAEKTMGIRYTTLATYYAMPEFAPTVLNKRITPLVEAYNVNLAYFEDENEKQMFVEPEAPPEDEQKEMMHTLVDNTAELIETTNELLKEVHVLAHNSERLIERIAQLEEANAEKDKIIMHLAQQLQPPKT